jgi:peptide/nickel transport system substrate-binding protein
MAGSGRSRRGRGVAVFFVVALVAAACSDDGSPDTAAPSETTGVAPPVTTAGPTTAVATETGDGPVHGGRLVYGIDADTANPFVHYASSCALACRLIFRAITEPLFITDADGRIVPYLVETVESNEDRTVWTLTIRDGISFHDGTALTGSAVAHNIDTCRLSALTGPAFQGLEDVSAEGQTVTLTYSRPSAAGPQLLRGETCGMMFSEKWLRSLISNPALTDEERASAFGDQAAPVGLGPFEFVSYQPGNGNSFVARRFDGYWRGDGPESVTGEGLPYLDEIEFVVAADTAGRSAGLEAGDFDVIHTFNADEIARFLDDDAYDVVASDAFGQTGYILFNTAQGTNPTVAALRGLDELEMDPTGRNDDSPLVVESCRRALALATDRERIAQERGAGLVRVANGPFPPGSIGYLEDTGFPQFDVEAARAEMATCLAEYGGEEISFTFMTTPDPFNVETNTLVAGMWEEAFGDQIDVTINTMEQGQYIGLALSGLFDAVAWISHGGVDPAEEWFWWSSSTASPINPAAGELALNFGRFQNETIDAALEVILTSADEDARREAAETVNREFGARVYDLWVSWTLSAAISEPTVQDLTELPLLDGGTSFGLLGGKHWLAQVWCTDGRC